LGIIKLNRNNMCARQANVNKCLKSPFTMRFNNINFPESLKSTVNRNLKKAANVLSYKRLLHFSYYANRNYAFVYVLVVFNKI